MEDIIKKAIEGGYDWWKSRYPELNHTKEEMTEFLLHDYEKPSFADIVCDPLFWQALGKVCGWGIEIQGEKGDVHVNHEYNNGKCTELCVVPSVDFALHFHKLNLTEGWQAAVAWLASLVA
jgi:hypothetical protein